MRRLGVEFVRAPVGDRHVLAKLVECGGMLGGETSGHILSLDRTTTGDGLITALQVLAIMKETGRPLAELAAGMDKLPQVLLNVEVESRFDPGTVPSIIAAAAAHRGAPGWRGPGGSACLGDRTGHPRHGRGAGRGRGAQLRGRSGAGGSGGSPAQAGDHLR